VRITFAVTKENEGGLPVSDTPKTSSWRNLDTSRPPPSLYITIGHRLGFAPRFYRCSSASRYFCQLYRRLSPGILVTRKQAGDIMPEKVFTLFESFHTPEWKEDSSPRYRRTIADSFRSRIPSTAFSSVSVQLPRSPFAFQIDISAR